MLTGLMNMTSCQSSSVLCMEMMTMLMLLGPPLIRTK